MKILKNLPGALKNGLFSDNPVLFQLAFLCPALMASASAKSGLRLGLAIMFTLVCTATCVSALRYITQQRLLFLVCAITAAFFTSTADLVFQAYSPEFSAVMGIFIPLLAVGCFTLCQPGGIIGGRGVLESALVSACMGLGATLALCAAGALRTLLSGGAGLFDGISFFSTPAGAFIALGLVAGLFQLVPRVFGFIHPSREQHSSRRRGNAPEPGAPGDAGGGEVQ